ncbi:TetR family transcriptional regulator [Paenibacillus sp. J31TS4]|uniref:TetR family transcriptional regulator n=1 Tax=Paenibacillus sp. J31TS4 TaxID=2807195 RepID=UPI001BD05149|nr:TetR family transcriptional regulator [Paenibacillus sp. J31TS4]
MQAAIRVFQEKGYQVTTMKDIALETGLSRGTLYLYFSSTDEIFEAILEHFEAAGTLNLDMLLSKSTSVYEAIRSLLQMQEDAVTGAAESFTPTLLEYLLIARKEKERHVKLSMRYDLGYRLLKELLQAGVNRGEFNPLIPVDQIAHTMLSLFNGMTMNALSAGDKKINVKGQMEVLDLSLRHLLQAGSDRNDE